MMDTRALQSILEGLKYNVNRLHVRVLALEGRKNIEAPEPKVEKKAQISDAFAIFWCRVNQAKIEFGNEGVSISLGQENPPRLFNGKNLIEAVEKAKEFVEASTHDSMLMEGGIVGLL
ncbi:MAG: hypothetical protein ACE5HN_01390 [Nitrospiria bacterium]